VTLNGKSNAHALIVDYKRWLITHVAAHVAAEQSVEIYIHCIACALTFVTSFDPLLL